MDIYLINNCYVMVADVKECSGDCIDCPGGENFDSISLEGLKSLHTGGVGCLKLDDSVGNKVHKIVSYPDDISYEAI